LALSDPARLSIEHAEIDYGGGPVVREFDLTVAPGEVVALLGANGSGRTSLLRAVSGFIPLSKGRITLDGRDVSRWSPERRAKAGLMFIPDDAGLFPRLTVDDHLRLAAHGHAPADRLDAAFEFFPQLTARRKVAAGALSGGEARMLTLSLALLVRPTVLLVDELSFGLAPIVVLDLLKLCRRFASEFSAAILLVEQFVDLALRNADRAVVLTKGATTFTGDAVQLRNDPQALASIHLGGADELIGTGSTRPVDL
jgi:branched-chain amino acid transport system ATP-binding protein